MSAVPLRLGPGADLRRAIDSASEIVALSGSVSVDGAHLHAAIALSDGRVLGGHLAYGSVVRTTAELLIEPLDHWRLTREHDDSTGYDERVVRARAR